MIRLTYRCFEQWSIDVVCDWMCRNTFRNMSFFYQSPNHASLASHASYACLIGYIGRAYVNISRLLRKLPRLILDMCFIKGSNVHDDVIKWKHFLLCWPFVRGIYRSSLNYPHKGQWSGALIFSLNCARINGWVNNGEAGDLRRNRAHHDVTVMLQWRRMWYNWQYTLFDLSEKEWSKTISQRLTYFSHLSVHNTAFAIRTSFVDNPHGKGAFWTSANANRAVAGILFDILCILKYTPGCMHLKRKKLCCYL